MLAELRVGGGKKAHTMGSFTCGKEPESFQDPDLVTSLQG